MNKKEAIQAMLEGKKVRHITWANESMYLFMDGVGDFRTMIGLKDGLNNYPFEGWKIYADAPKFKEKEFVYDRISNKYVRIISIRRPIFLEDFVYAVESGIKDQSWNVTEGHLQAVTD